MGRSFYPGRADANLACSSLSPTPALECEGLAPPALDSYGTIPLEQEKLRLDNFAITLLRERNAVGYIIAYAGKRTRAGEAKELTERAESYLVKVRSFPPNRLKSINGGYREERQVELYVVKDKTCPPVAAPTVDPRDVQIIRPRKQKEARPS